MCPRAPHQYEVPLRDIIDSLSELIQRENIRVMGTRSNALVEMLVRARSMPGRPIPDALIVAATIVSEATALATFERGQARYGFPVQVPSAS